MDAVRLPPSGIYSKPPDGQLPKTCPNCNCSLEHFHQVAPAATVTPPPPEPRLIRQTEQQRSKVITPPVLVPTSPIKHPEANRLNVLDEGLGGKVTICVLLYGPHTDLHRRCLNSIVQTVPPSRMDLRVACNQVVDETMKYLKTLPIQKIYSDTGNRHKYPAMRAMFHDRELPIETKWIVWFDDDSYVRQGNWLSLLGDAIKHLDPREKVGMLGAKMYHRFPGTKHDPRAWFQAANWWRNVPFRDSRGVDIPNGNAIHFCVGGFWALRTDAMLDCDIPDIRLDHNGGDITIGEQLHQGGYRTKSFNGKKELVHTSAAPRRGFAQVFPWLTA